MKSWIGEYGKIAAMAIILAVLFAFVWNRTDRGYLGALSKAEPKSFLKATDNSDFLVQLKPRPDPVLTVSVSKLKYQRRYDLLHGKEISARAVDADGRELPVSVIKLIAPDGSQLEKELQFLQEPDIHHPHDVQSQSDTDPRLLRRKAHLLCFLLFRLELCPPASTETEALLHNDIH